MTTMTLSGWVASAGLLGTLVVGASVRAQDFPSQTIRMIVPYGTGGLTDITSRTLAPFIGEALGATIVVDNRPGASTMLGTEAVAKGRPDGHTVLLASGSALSANPLLFKSMPYDAIKDLAPIALVATVPYVVVVHPSVPANSVNDLIVMARAKPKGINYSSAGNGSGNHLSAELFASAAGVQFQHIPYKSGGAMVSDLIGGHVALAFAALPTALSHVKSGKLRALATSSERRNSELPDVPTISESGLPGFVVSEWIGIFAPAGTPQAVVGRFNAAAVKVLQTPEVVQKLKMLGADAVSGPPGRLADLLKSDTERWAKLAQHVKFEAQ